MTPFGPQRFDKLKRLSYSKGSRAFESKRLFDLKRWGTFYSVLINDPVAKTGLKPEHVFLAIPQREIDVAAGLGQSPGY